MKYVILFLIFIILMLWMNRNNTEDFVTIKKIEGPIKWGRNTCNYQMNNTLSGVLDTHKMTETDKDWNLYMPCTYDDINGEIEKMKVDANGRYFIIDGADEITAKNVIWDNMVKYYGRNEASKLMPTTYILYEPEDMKLLESEYTTDKLYIMKKNIQRQEGLKITNKYDDIKQARKDGYVIVQELLQDPYLINGRKINIRFYVLFVCQNGDMSCYVHNDGFMYYTKEMYKRGTITHDHNVTTGYIDRKVYDENPLTQEDFRKYLDEERDLTRPEIEVKQSGRQISKVVFGRVYEMLKKVMISLNKKMCQGSQLKPALTFQMFGCDVAIGENLDAKIIEANKGPDLGKKDERDGVVKTAVVTDMMRLLGFLDGDDNGYIKLFDTDGANIIEQEFDI